MWRKYKNRNRQSMIQSYSLNRAQKEFKVKMTFNSQAYIIREEVVGHDHFENLVELAKLGKGLNRYIDKLNLDLTDMTIDN